MMVKIYNVHIIKNLNENLTVKKKSLYQKILVTVKKKIPAPKNISCKIKLL